jgi:hypothetical protein
VFVPDSRRPCVTGFLALAAALLVSAGCDCPRTRDPNLELGWFDFQRNFYSFSESTIPVITPPQGGGAGVVVGVQARGLSSGAYHFNIDVQVEGVPVHSEGGDLDAGLRCDKPYGHSANIPILLPGTSIAQLEGRVGNINVVITGQGYEGSASATAILAAPQQP